jgi:ribosomal-protein-alanine N-acetyltransferase
MKNEDYKFPILQTERLILRELNECDAKILFEYWSDNEVTRHMNIDAFTDICGAKEMIKVLNTLFKEKQAIRWGIYNKELDCLIGTCGYNSGLKQEVYVGEIGYELGSQFWGNGFMAEALSCILNYGFKTLNLNRIEAYVMLENQRSVILLEKLGFQKEGILREHGHYKNSFWDEYIFSLLKSDRS